MFANQLLLIANQFEIVEQKMLIVLNSLFSPLIQTNIKSQTWTSGGKRVIKVPDTILPLVVKSTLVNDRSSDRIM